MSACRRECGRLRSSRGRNDPAEGMRDDLTALLAFVQAEESKNLGRHHAEGFGRSHFGGAALAYGAVKVRIEDMLARQDAAA